MSLVLCLMSLLCAVLWFKSGAPALGWIWVGAAVAWLVSALLEAA